MKCKDCKVAEASPKAMRCLSCLEVLFAGYGLILSEYAGAANLSTCFCAACGEKVNRRLSHLQKGNPSCPYCECGKLRTDDVSMLCALHNIELLEAFTYTYQPTLARHIPCGRTLKVVVGEMRRGSRPCTYCAGNARLTQGEASVRFKEKGFTLLGEYHSNKRHVLIRHDSCGLKYKATPSNIWAGANCPDCSKHGFSRDNPASFYIVENTDVNACKFGISGNVDYRLYEHQLQGFSKLIYLARFDSGHKAYDLEISVKSILAGKCSVVSPEIMPYGGHTETFKTANLNIVLEYLNDSR